MSHRRRVLGQLRGCPTARGDRRGRRGGAARTITASGGAVQSGRPGSGDRGTVRRARRPRGHTCVAATSRTWPRMRTGEGICINILGEDQQDVSARLSSSGAEKFDDVAWTLSADGNPVLHGVLTWLECTVADEYRAGDHYIVVSRVDRAATAADGAPLVRNRGRYVRLAGPGTHKEVCP
ncbi:flavin reductase family protein [Streptomyces nodosus]|uniref:flavin reductase family protein n=1 Tax=Streptomyces nodosus TaxID=40318 RepID=UPI0034527CE2